MSKAVRSLQEDGFLTSSALGAYRAFQRTGLQRSRWFQKLFLASYFAYKKYIEDGFDGLAKKRRDLFEHGHILDVGANVGYTTQVFCDAVAKDFKVFAFEPEPKNFRALAERFAKSPVVETLQCAVGDRDGSADLWINTNHPGDHRILTPRLRESLGGARFLPTKMVRIDSFATEHGIEKSIGFVKIDVQGYELPVCRGMERVIHESRPVIALEYAPRLLEEVGYSASDLSSFMTGLRYGPRVIGRGGVLHRTNWAELGETLGGGQYLDLLLIPEDARTTDAFEG